MSEDIESAKTRGPWESDFWCYSTPDDTDEKEFTVPKPLIVDLETGYPKDRVPRLPGIDLDWS